MLARATLAILVTGVIILGLTPTMMMTVHNAIAQTTNATTTASSNSTTTLAPASSSSKIFYLFSAEHEGVNSYLITNSYLMKRNWEFHQIHIHRMF